MAIKITADKSKKVDITAKKGDDFSVNLEIKNESGSLLEFTRDGYTYEKYNDHISNTTPITSEDKWKWLGEEDVMLFVVTTEDDTPVLAACSSDLDLAMFSQELDPTHHLTDTDGGLYTNPTNQRDFDKYYDYIHMYKIMGVAKSMSKASNRNTELERSNYGIENLVFTETYLKTLIDFNAYGSTQMSTSVNYRTWLQNIFTNYDVISDTNLLNVIRDTVEGFTETTGNDYIFWGRVEGNNAFTIKFDHSQFNLPAGNYKYTFKSLSDYNKALSTNNDTLNYGVDSDSGNLYTNITTWMHGKLRVNE
tara:strand:+ start:2089 stop:3009 length:921 start_codon:yes stop_codon:yes gene_type:complete